MTLIVCFDMRRGVTFFGKRQSADAKVRDRIARLANGKPIYMTVYSASLFKNTDADVRIAEELESAPQDAAVFAEDAGLSAFCGRVTRFVIYRWNKLYPRDGTAGFYPFDEGMKLVSMTDFEGSSHSRVTEEIWEAL